jgi:hypothetical protein
MCVPGVVGPTLNNHVARPQSRLAAFENERCFTLQETNDVDRMGLMHSWMARLIDDVTSTVKCGKPFAHGSVKNRFGYAFRQRTDYAPGNCPFGVRAPGAWSRDLRGRLASKPRRLRPPRSRTVRPDRDCRFRDEEPPSMIMTDWPWALSPVITRRMAS